MLIVTVSARAAAAHRAEVVSACREIAAASRKDDGCISYSFYADLDDENVILSLELWRDQAALDAHMAHPHTQEFLASIPELLDGAPALVIHQVADKH